MKFKSFNKISESFRFKTSQVWIAKLFVLIVIITGDCLVQLFGNSHYFALEICKEKNSKQIKQRFHELFIMDYPATSLDTVQMRKSLNTKQVGSLQ